MNIIDYLFYRLYLIFEKKKEFARLTACLVLGEMFLYAFFFTLIFTTFFLTGSYFITLGWSRGSVFVVVICGLVIQQIITYKYYNKKRIRKLLLLYKGHRLNKLISDNCVLLCIKAELVSGLLLWFLIDHIFN